MTKGRTVENERKWQEKPSSPSLINPHLHPYFCFRHFYLSAFCPFDQSRIYPSSQTLTVLLIFSMKLLVIEQESVESSIETRHERDQSFLVPVPARKNFRFRSRSEKNFGAGPSKKTFRFRSRNHFAHV